jgi:GT2 family glycosyltransferase
MPSPSHDRPAARVTVAIPSLDHGRFLDEAIRSVASQPVPCEIFVADGGSTDNSRDVIARWTDVLAGWTSGPDGGQSAAINAAIARGTAPYVAWMNADDTYLPEGLAILSRALDDHPEAPMVYGRAWITDDAGNRRVLAGRMPANRFVMSQRCPISQPATLIRRSVGEALGGLDESLHYAMDYDFWWRILLRFGEPLQIPDAVATSRAHLDTKTARARSTHNAEAVAVVRRHFGRVPLKWKLAWPVSVLGRSLYYRARRATQRAR